jgi:glycerophosphoryl diester phosphodiesterase
VKPRIVAHRGSSHAQAEHTLGAYEAALDEGAEGLECDVRLTADGHLVCVHDRRVDRTANARGTVSTMDLEALNDLDFASWKNPWADFDDEAPDIDEETKRVLTLKRLLEMVADYDRKVELFVETKHPTRYAGLVERRLVELLDSFGWAGSNSPACVLSFSLVALTRVRRLAPRLDTVMLFDRMYSWHAVRNLAGEGWVIAPAIDLLRDSPAFSRRLRRSGRRIYAWVVNSPEDFDLCAGIGVEAVITDRPRQLLTHRTAQV